MTDWRKCKNCGQVYPVGYPACKCTPEQRGPDLGAAPYLDLSGPPDNRRLTETCKRCNGHGHVKFGSQENG